MSVLYIAFSVLLIVISARTTGEPMSTGVHTFEDVYQVSIEVKHSL